MKFLSEFRQVKLATTRNLLRFTTNALMTFLEMITDELFPPNPQRGNELE